MGKEWDERKVQKNIFMDVTNWFKELEETIVATIFYRATRKKREETTDEDVQNAMQEITLAQDCHQSTNLIGRRN